MADEVLEYYSKVFDEVYEVVRTVDIIHDDKFYRFEVVRGYTNTNVPYTVHAWVQDDVKVEEDDEPKCVWIQDNSQPWVACESAEGALSQALGFLADAVSPKS